MSRWGEGGGEGMEETRLICTLCRVRVDKVTSDEEKLSLGEGDLNLASFPVCGCWWRFRRGRGGLVKLRER